MGVERYAEVTAPVPEASKDKKGANRGKQDGINKHEKKKKGKKRSAEKKRKKVRMGIRLNQ